MCLPISGRPYGPLQTAEGFFTGGPLTRDFFLFYRIFKLGFQGIGIYRHSQFALHILPPSSCQSSNRGLPAPISYTGIWGYLPSFCIFKRLFQITPEETRCMICRKRSINTCIVIGFLRIIQQFSFFQGIFKFRLSVQKVQLADAPMFTDILRHPIISTDVGWVRLHCLSAITFTLFVPHSLFLIALCMIGGQLEATSGKGDKRFARSCCWKIRLGGCVSKCFRRFLPRM